MREEERLIRAIGGIDDELILEAEQWRPEKKKKHRGWIAAAAACLCLLILWQGGLLPFSRMGGDREPSHSLWKEEFPSPEAFFGELASAENTGGGNSSSEHAETAVPGGSGTGTSAQTDPRKEPVSEAQTPGNTDPEAVRDDVDTSHIWKEGFPPEAYFVGSSAVGDAGGGGASSGTSEALMPGSEETKITPLTGEWKALENKGLIPPLTGWEEFYGLMTEEENRTDVWIQWIRTGPTGPPNLSVMLSAGEGREVKQNGILNRRDGVSVFAAGTEKTSKQLSYERGDIVTTITGSDKVTFAEMVEVLDWYWAHPDTLERFCEWAGQEEETEK